MNLRKPNVSKTIKYRVGDTVYGEVMSFKETDTLYGLVAIMSTLLREKFFFKVLRDHGGKICLALYIKKGYDLELGTEDKDYYRLLFSPDSISIISKSSSKEMRYYVPCLKLETEVKKEHT